jgi:NAD(P)-dependent dehydrogenase (short-subunit alcohol dehydrogenase family)
VTELTGLTSIVTGASSGIGRAIARALASAGSSVVCCDVRKSAREEGYEADLAVDTDDAIRGDGGASSFVEADVTNAADVKRVVSSAVATYGSLDVMVNNAGVWTGPHSIVEETEEQYDLTMAVNCKGVWLGCKFAIEQMRKGKKGGRIVNIASMAALVGLEEEPAYCASKGAVVALTRQLALDFASDRISANAVCPGFIQTALARPVMGVSAEHGMTPWGRLGTPEEVARAVVFLASPQSEWLTGTAFVVDGGFTAR